jgi:hypothetical protein
MVQVFGRTREVEQRRNVADALAQVYERGETERMREVFINLQNTIKAIERNKFAKRHYEAIATAIQEARRKVEIDGTATGSQAWSMHWP